MSDEVAAVIEAAEIDSVCEPRQGDCESVAVALARVFDVDAFVCVYEPGEKRYATHATVEIDGRLYDGTGRTSREALIEYLGAFAPRDFPGVEDHEEMVEMFRKEQIAELSPSPSVLKADPEVVERVEERVSAVTE